MNKYLSEYFRAMRYVFYPRRCAFCGKVVPPTVSCCASCVKAVERVPLPICYSCGRGKIHCMCKQEHSPFIEASAAPFYYKGVVRHSIHRMKFRGEHDIAETLGEEMADFARTVFGDLKIDFVTFVPMSKKENRERGFNQSACLATYVADNLHLPKQAVLVKLYETTRQRGLSPRMRSGNVLGVFDVTDRLAVKGKRILLCDDVKTSGSTLNECAKMLRIHGATEVFCLTVAVTKREEKE